MKSIHKKVIIGIAIGISILLLGFICYKVFFNKYKDSTDDNNECVVNCNEEEPDDLVDTTKDITINEEDKNKTGSYLNQNYYLGYITLEGDISILNEINSDIEGEYFDIKKNCNLANDSTICSSSYSYSINNDILSLVIEYRAFIPDSSSDSKKYYIYNIDLKNNKRLSNDELFNIYNTSSKNILTKLENLIEEDINVIDMDLVYINVDNEIVVIVPFINVMGSTYYTKYSIK